MKILIVTDAWLPQVNGVVRTLEYTAADLEKWGHEVEFLTPQGFKTMPMPTYPDIRLSLFPYRKVKAFIEELKPEAIHIATEGPLGMAARKWCLQQNVPFTTAYHSRFPEYVQLRTGLPLSVSYAWLRRFHGAARHVMVPTPVVRKDLEAQGFTNVATWSHGVDLNRFHPEGEKNALPGEPPVFLYVGRVAVEKNLDAFLSLDLPGCKWVAGVGPARERLMKEYPEVNWLGVLDSVQLAAAYRSASVFVFPSKTDTFGLVMLEAMACGCPVAAYPVTGPLDVIGDSDAGVMEEDLKLACLKALVIDRATPRLYAEQFAWEKASEQFLSWLCQIVWEGSKPYEKTKQLAIA
ncbi:glycosyltransferase family 1 protein [Leeia sp. TBRC 13508]|uniref:Glycosyltransferase family 1 protein n=1 Tax=Leeia speluncae TaxID=2884804 RepID=A0ABS8D525_9NEIS|nr:glycosyltransferase family 1 protein [Leeia speluncae]MCB6183272.1 glycosyltransferase family 1 protein [Leeia speluncae]